MCVVCSPYGVSNEACNPLGFPESTYQPLEADSVSKVFAGDRVIHVERCA